MSKHVIIAGGGPAGLLTALGLAMDGASVTVLEADDKPNDSPRALVYPGSLMDHFQKLGIFDECVRRGVLKSRLDWFVRHTGDFVRLSMDVLKDDTAHPYSLHLGQDQIALITLDRLATFPNVSVLFSSRVTGVAQNSTGVRVTFDRAGQSEDLTGDWLVAADGAASTIREKLLGMNFFGITWPERFVATNIIYDFEAHDFGLTTFQVDHELGAVIVRINPEGLWRVTYMEDASLPVEGVRDRIPQTFARLLPGGGPFELVQFSPYRMHQRCVDTMRRGRILFAGDAAHITNPTGGLGLTSGVFDSIALVETLGQILHEGRDEAILDVYSDDRRRRFLEFASPQAVRNKQNVFHAGPGALTDAWLDRMRQIEKSPDMMRQMFSFSQNLRSTYLQAS